MRAKPGDRVIAIRNVEPGTAYVYGAGVYRGDERPPNGTRSPFGFVDDDYPPDYKNPRIDLDRGGTVWGFQCWWGPEDFVRKQLQGHELVEVPLPSDEAN
jgi:hypothetical protein